MVASNLARWRRPYSCWPKPCSYAPSPRGVETLEEVEALRRIGCEFMQGYYFARPLGEAEVADLLVQNLVHGRTLPIAVQGSPLLEAALHRERRAAHG